MINALEPPEFSNSVLLLDGTASEIGEALRLLWALPSTIAQAMISFSFRKIPGAKVSKILNGFMIGQSFLPETQSKATREINATQNRFAGLMAANDGRAALAV